MAQKWQCQREVIIEQPLTAANVQIFKVSSLLPCGSESFIIFRPSSARLLINQFLVGNMYCKMCHYI